ncbi:hypothetical protein HDV00_005547 [Rhizophlyctis rosea]|nr:hypothetical protein HDV00_005547 [Rhizophlyctis rosea]
MDTFVDSTWYWLRYCDPHTPDRMCDPAKAASLLPVDMYIGGAEHSILHLLYARFIAKVLNDEGIVDLPNGEPFKKLLTQGMVLAKSYRDPSSGRYLRKSELDLSDPEKPVLKSTGSIADVAWEKMSKSKYNGVDPLEVIERHGVDATRLHILYLAPPAEDLAWNETAIVGMERWLSRLWAVIVDADAGGKKKKLRDDDLEFWVHSTIKEVTDALTKTFSFNVAIASLIKLSHRLADASPASKGFQEAKETIVIMVSPFAPCVAEDMWSRMGKEGSVFGARWPDFDVEKLKREEVVCVVQVNGKTKGTIMVPASVGGDAAELERLIRDSTIGREHLVDEKGGIVAKRVIVVRGGKLVNFVI